MSETTVHRTSLVTSEPACNCNAMEYSSFEMETKIRDISLSGICRRERLAIGLLVSHREDQVQCWRVFVGLSIPKKKVV